MKIRCHQVVQGHSMKDAYAARLIVSQKGNEKNSPKSIDFSFADSRREISDDKNNYVLEIQPVDNLFHRTAAVCSQWKTTGSPSKYTHWLIPEDGTTESAFRLLNRSYFMNGSEMSEFYESSKVLMMKDVEVSDEKLEPQWVMSDLQNKSLKQFLALYWTCLTRRSMGAQADIQLPLVLRDENTNEILTNEQAAAFFAREIYSRMPLEARGMISVSFGIKWSEAQNGFKKTVCAVLSEEKGVSSEKKIDLLTNNKDLLSKYPHDDRIALNTIGSCLMEGEGSYPGWYIALRGMKEGIPCAVAPTLMHICCVLKELEALDQPEPAQISMMEKCYSVILLHIKKANGNTEEAQQILQPLAKKIIFLWGQQKHPRLEYYASKRAWAQEQTDLTEDQISELMEPLAVKVLDELQNSVKMPSAERITDATALLKYQTSAQNADIINRLERYLAENFEDWILAAADGSDFSTFSGRSLKNILDQCDIQSFKADPGKLINAFHAIVSSYNDLDETVKEKANRSLGILWVKDKVEQLCRAEKNGRQPDVSEIKDLAEHIREIGTDGPAKGVAAEGISFIERHYLCWVSEESAVVPDDDRFLELAKRWITGKSLDICGSLDSKTLDTIENNLSDVLDAYHVPKSEADADLAGFRRLKGDVCLQEIASNDNLDDAEKASKICDLHYVLRNQNGVLSENDDLDRHFTDVIQPYFRAWQKTEPPFTSNQNARYRDDWFVFVARTWINRQFRNEEMTSSETEKLLADLEKAMRGYRLGDNDRSAVLVPVYRSWSKLALQELQADMNVLNPQEKALCIAEIHNRLQEAGLCRDEEGEENRELTDEMLNHYLAWSECEKPFSGGRDQKYTDNWFVSVTASWIRHELSDQDLTAEQIEELEKKILSVLKIYQVDELRRNEILSGLRVRWGEEKLHSFRNLENADPESVLSVAEIHDRLRRLGCNSDDNSQIEEEIRFELLEHYLEWGKVSKPFASNHEQKYTDDLFVSVTEEWLDHYVEQSNLNADELEELETRIISALKSYNAPEDIRIKTRLAVRRLWSNQKLSSVGTDITLNNTQKALEIAGIHNHLRKLYGSAPMDSDTEEELKKELVSLFPDWGDASKPFASSNRLVYEDDWFITVVKDWLDYNVQDTSLTSVQLDSLEKKLTAALNVYRVSKDEQIQLLSPLKTEWGKRKLNEIKDNSNDDRTAFALAVAGIHNQLRKTNGVITPEFEEDLMYELLDSFVSWGLASRPFASSDNMRYEDVWFGSVFERWTGERLETEYYSSNQWHDLVKQLEEAVRAYHLPEGEKLLSIVKKKYADEYINENLGSMPGNDVNERMAELLFRDRAVSSDDDLKDKLTDYLAAHFVDWSNTVPPFKIGSSERGSTGYGGGGAFLTVYEKWQYQYLSDTADKCKLTDIRDCVRKAFETFRLPLRSFDEYSVRINYHIKRERFDELRNETVRPETVSEVAGIRKWLEDNGQAHDRYLVHDIENYIRDHIDVWLQNDKPLYTEGYGYTDDFALPALEEWLDSRIDNHNWSQEELNALSRRIDFALKEFRRCGKDVNEDILNSIRRAELKAFINDLPDSELNAVQLKGLIDRFASLDESDERLKRRYIEKLSENYVTWAVSEPPFDWKGNDTELKNSLILKATGEWLDHAFAKRTVRYEELVRIKQGLISAFRYSDCSEDERKKLNEYLIIMEKNWLKKAIKVYPGDQLTISQIAAAPKRIQKENGLLNDDEDRALERFLVNRFLLWWKEAFHSEDGYEMYTYDRFGEVIQEWVRTGQINQIDLEKINQIEKTIEKVLEKGYKYSLPECGQIMGSFFTEKNGRLLDETRGNYNVDNLQMIVKLYEQYPKDYYQKIYPIYTDLIKQKKAREQVVDFFGVQGNVWKNCKDNGLRREMIEFLDKAYLSFSAEERPDELKESMSTILKYERYDLSGYMMDSGEAAGWDQLKGFIIDRYIKKLFKDTGSISELQEKWEKQYYPLNSIDWNTAVKRQMFRKELINAIRRSGVMKEHPEESVRILVELTKYSTRGLSENYRKTLMAAIAEMIQEDYSTLSEKPQHQDAVESIISYLEKNHIDVTQIKSSNEYIAKSYMRSYAQLLKDWDQKRAVDMLDSRPPVIETAGGRLEKPGPFDKTDKWLLLNLLFGVPKAKGYEYWGRIITEERINLSELNGSDIKEERVVKFIKCLQWNYDILIKAHINWALEELKDHIKSSAPDLWKALHPFVIIGTGNVLKKLGMDRKDFSDGFYDWLFRGK